MKPALTLACHPTHEDTPADQHIRAAVRGSFIGLPFFYDRGNRSTVSDLSRFVESVNTLHSEDPYTAAHCMRVGRFARAMALEMQLPATQVKQIGFAGELHDIGKTHIPLDLLNKRDALTQDEYEQVMQHTVVGDALVGPLPLKDPTVRQVVRWHHERMDGRGGPDGLFGHDIPLSARIVSVADAFDAMTSTRPYRSSLPLNVASKELHRHSGTQFDQACVQALERILRRTQRAILLYKDGGIERSACAA